VSHASRRPDAEAVGTHPPRPVPVPTEPVIYNLAGQLIETLVVGHQDIGEHKLVWDASEVSSGLYFYKLTAGDCTETKRMMLVK